MVQLAWSRLLLRLVHDAVAESDLLDLPLEDALLDRVRRQQPIGEHARSGLPVAPHAAADLRISSGVPVGVEQDEPRRANQVEPGAARL